MKLVRNWKTIAFTAHSMWAFYLSALCLILPDLIYLLFWVDTNPRTWRFLGLGLLIYGILWRLRDQGIDRDKMQSSWYVGAFIFLAVVASLLFDPATQRLTSGPTTPPDIVIIHGDQQSPEDAFSAMAVPFIGKWEGLRLQAYQDIVGVWTVCYGETKGVKPGDSYTRAECDAMLASEVMEYRDGWHRYLDVDTIGEPLPVARDVAFVSLAYNVGVAGAGNSTATRRLNAGDVAGACVALTWWNKAGGRVIRGLVNRRTEERTLCERGLT